MIKENQKQSVATVKRYGKSRKKEGGSVFDYLLCQERKMREMKRIRAAEKIRSTLNRLMRFCGGADFTFAMFNSDLMDGFEAHMKAEGLVRNTTSFYMRTLQRCYLSAVEEGKTSNHHPFRHVYKGKDKTIKRALTMSDIKRILDLDLTGRPQLEYARDIFLFSFYSRGMSFVDIAFLRKTDLVGDHFTYRRRKTGQILLIEWVTPMQEILDKYPQNKTDFLLPIITNPDMDLRQQYLHMSNRIYRWLKEVGRRAHIPGPVTMYRARHSWATIARNKNVPLCVISEALGHDNEKTTEIYLDSIHDSIVDKYNKQLIEDLLG